MQSLYQFIIKPLKERYDNVKKISDKELIINTSIENHVFVSKFAKVVSTPSAFKTTINVGDEVVVHHNIFRRWYDQKGRERNSSSFFKDDMFFCNVDQVYLYKKNGEWVTNLNYCFVKPIASTSVLSTDKEKPLIGIIKYDNEALNNIGIEKEMLITFSPNSEFEFIIDDERLYCMKSNNIAIEHERKGNEEEYNPSWTSSS